MKQRGLSLTAIAFLLAAGVTFASSACGGDDEGDTTTDAGPDGPADDGAGNPTGDAGGKADTGTPPSGDSGTPPGTDAAASIAHVTVTTFAASLTTPRGMPQLATWAAVQIGTGPWTVLTGTAGLYNFDVPDDDTAWGIAIVCADDTSADVWVHYRTGATKSLNQDLSKYCTPQTPTAAPVTLTGTLTGYPSDIAWLDFAYARDSRGAVFNFPVVTTDAGPDAGDAGFDAAVPTSAPYEIDQVYPGTWDVAFGARNDGFAPLERVAVLRNKAIDGVNPLNVDFDGGGFTPDQGTINVQNVGVTETLSVAVAYALNNGRFGLDVSPPDVPTTTPSATMTYAAVTAAVQIPADRYRGLVSSDDVGVSRGALFDFHTKTTVNVTLLPPLGTQTVTSTTTPYVRFMTTQDLPAAPARVEIGSVKDEGGSVHHAWITSYDTLTAGQSPLTEMPPDLSALAGWKASWVMSDPSGATVTSTVYDGQQPLADGNVERSASAIYDVP